MLRISSRLYAVSTSLAGCLLVSSVALYAQATGRIGGTITDSSGAVVVHVNIACKNQETGIIRRAVSNDLGIFEFPDLPIGKYEVEATLQGFQQSKVNVSLV